MPAFEIPRRGPGRNFTLGDPGPAAPGAEAQGAIQGINAIRSGLRRRQQQVDENIARDRVRAERAAQAKRSEFRLEAAIIGDELTRDLDDIPLLDKADPDGAGTVDRFLESYDKALSDRMASMSLSPEARESLTQDHTLHRLSFERALRAKVDEQQDAALQEVFALNTEMVAESLPSEQIAQMSVSDLSSPYESLASEFGFLFDDVSKRDNYVEGQVAALLGSAIQDRELGFFESASAYFKSYGLSQQAGRDLRAGAFRFLEAKRQQQMSLLQDGVDSGEVTVQDLQGIQDDLRYTIEQGKKAAKDHPFFNYEGDQISGSLASMDYALGLTIAKATALEQTQQLVLADVMPGGASSGIQYTTPGLVEALNQQSERVASGFLLESYEQGGSRGMLETVGLVASELGFTPSGYINGLLAMFDSGDARQSLAAAETLNGLAKTSYFHTRRFDDDGNMLPPVSPIRGRDDLAKLGAILDLTQSPYGRSRTPEEVLALAAMTDEELDGEIEGQNLLVTTGFVEIEGREKGAPSPTDDHFGLAEFQEAYDQATPEMFRDFTYELELAFAQTGGSPSKALRLAKQQLESRWKRGETISGDPVWTKDGPANWDPRGMEFLLNEIKAKTGKDVRGSENFRLKRVLITPEMASRASPEERGFLRGSIGRHLYQLVEVVNGAEYQVMKLNGEILGPMAPDPSYSDKMVGAREKQGFQEHLKAGDAARDLLDVLSRNPETFPSVSEESVDALLKRSAGLGWSNRPEKQKKKIELQIGRALDQVESEYRRLRDTPSRFGEDTRGLQNRLRRILKDLGREPSDVGIRRDTLPSDPELRGAARGGR